MGAAEHYEIFKICQLDPVGNKNDQMNPGSLLILTDETVFGTIHLYFQDLTNTD